MVGNSQQNSTLYLSTCSQRRKNDAIHLNVSKVKIILGLNIVPFICLYHNKIQNNVFSWIIKYLKLWFWICYVDFKQWCAGKYSKTGSSYRGRKKPWFVVFVSFHNENTPWLISTCLPVLLIANGEEMLTRGSVSNCKPNLADHYPKAVVVKWKIVKGLDHLACI